MLTVGGLWQLFLANLKLQMIDCKAWARLIRLPNVFTIIADVTAAMSVVVGGSGWWTLAPAQGVVWVPVAGSYGLLLVASVALYWAGMVLNDVFDVRRDARLRSERPLPMRQISIATARRAAWMLMLIGVIAASVVSATSLVVALILSVLIVLYDGPCKRTPIAPLLMGGCRVFSSLLGAAAGVAAVSPQSAWRTAATANLTALGPDVIGGLPAVSIAFAVGMGVYITGLTTFARRESIGDRTFHLTLGWWVMLAGGLMIAAAPRFGFLDPFWQLSARTSRWAWRLDAAIVYPVAVGLMLSPMLRRAWRASVAPSPATIQSAVGAALLALIPLSAVITALAVGPLVGGLVFALLIPARWLAGRFRVS